jgi:hypothetical protein
MIKGKGKQIQRAADHTADTGHNRRLDYVIQAYVPFVLVCHTQPLD